MSLDQHASPCEDGGVFGENESGVPVSGEPPDSLDGSGDVSCEHDWGQPGQGLRGC